MAFHPQQGLVLNCMSVGRQQGTSFAMSLGILPPEHTMQESQPSAIKRFIRSATASITLARVAASTEFGKAWYVLRSLRQDR